jgi:IclR family KDG regulon transcriptional repressor
MCECVRALDLSRERYHINEFLQARTLCQCAPDMTVDVGWRPRIGSVEYQDDELLDLPVEHKALACPAPGSVSRRYFRCFSFENFVPGFPMRIRHSDGTSRSTTSGTPGVRCYSSWALITHQPIASHGHAAREPDDGILATERSATKGAAISTSVAKACKLLSALADGGSGTGVSELARRAELNKATALRLLGTLADEGLVVQDNATKTWGLGVQVLALAQAFRQDLTLYQAARAYMSQLVLETQESVTLLMEDGGWGVAIARAEPDSPLYVRQHVGERRPLYVGATRKVMLANVPDEALKRYLATVELQAFTPNTITDVDRLRQDLDLIRAQGYSVTDGELAEGIVGVSAAILIPAVGPVGSIGVAGPAFRFSREEAATLGPRLVEVAADIAQRMGARPAAPQAD